MAKTINLSGATLQRPIRAKRVKQVPQKLGKRKSWEGRANNAIQSKHAKRHGIRRSHVVGTVPNPGEVNHIYQCGVIWNEV